LQRRGRKFRQRSLGEIDDWGLGSGHGRRGLSDDGRKIFKVKGADFLRCIVFKESEVFSAKVPDGFSLLISDRDINQYQVMVNPESVHTLRFISTGRGLSPRFERGPKKKKPHGKAKKEFY
jgi:hypothetical protein